MKKSYCELEIYAERRYIAYSYSKHYIKALYWLLKYKYYKKRHEQQFNSQDSAIITNLLNWKMCLEYRGVAKFGKALGLGPRNCRFKSCLPDHASVAQLVEQAAVNRWVARSSRA